MFQTTNQYWHVSRWIVIFHLKCWVILERWWKIPPRTLTIIVGKAVVTLEKSPSKVLLHLFLRFMKWGCRTMARHKFQKSQIVFSQTLPKKDGKTVNILPNPAFCRLTMVKLSTDWSKGNIYIGTSTGKHVLNPPHIRVSLQIFP